MNDEPIFSIEKVFDYIWGFLAAFGLIAFIAGLACLYGWHVYKTEYKYRTPAEIRHELRCKNG